jgi:hypothetical protein
MSSRSTIELTARGPDAGDSKATRLAFNLGQNMKKHLRNHVASLFLLAPCAVALVATPTIALAQSASPEVRSLEVRSDGEMEPGARLTFRVVGTPRARAVVRIGGIRERIELREVSRGLYIGRYRVKPGDRVESDSEVRAILRAENRSGSAEYTLAEVMSGQAPIAVAPPAPPPAPALRIERFSLGPIDRIEPGAELRFALDGFPGATVRVDLPGIDADVALREIRPGHYEGSYTIRRADNLNLSRPMVATLRMGERAVTANLTLQVAQPSGDNRPPNLVNLSPREGEAVAGGPAIQVSASFEDRGGSGVDPATVRINLSGRNVTGDAQITPTGFNLRAQLTPGRHTVDVSARDRAGNTLRKEWSFDVAAAAPVNVPLQIVNHGNNGQVERGNTQVVGRTAPFASVAVKVDAIAPVPGGFSVAQHVYSQTLQADANGNFSFNFSPRFPIPGTRYEIAMVASKANVNTEARLVLHQR